jgi:hypothetical protein
MSQEWLKTRAYLELLVCKVGANLDCCVKQNPKSSVELSTLSADGSLQVKFARVVATNGKNWILK